MKSYLKVNINLIFITTKVDYILFSETIIFISIASNNGNIEIVKELLNKNANIEAKSNTGYTPLMFGIFLNELFIFNSFI